MIARGLAIQTKHHINVVNIYAVAFCFYCYFALSSWVAEAITAYLCVVPMSNDDEVHRKKKRADGQTKKIQEGEKMLHHAYFHYASTKRGIKSYLYKKLLSFSPKCRDMNDQ